MGTLESNVIKALEPIINQSNDQEDFRVVALSKHLELTEEEEKEIHRHTKWSYRIRTKDKRGSRPK